MLFAKLPSRLLKSVYGALLALYLTAPAYAFTPAQVPLLSSSAVAPNVMLLVDNSGSMYNIIWSSAFDPRVNRTDVSYFSTQCVDALGVIVICPFETTISGDETLTLGDINSRGVILGISLNCILGGVPIRRSGTTYCLDLPDPAGNGRTRYTANYLSWLIDSVQPTRVSVLGIIGLVTVYYKDYTNGSIPNDYRMNVAKTVATNLVTNNTSLRIGLAQFNEPITGGDLGPGGRISRVITDLSPVTATVYQPNGVSQAQANTNITNLKNAIAALTPTANTPLAETYYEITRYFRGMTSYYPSAQTTYTSPVQYRCQKNYGVVITDGLPTYDRTFPANDPDDVADSSRSLPNWDLVANDGLRPVTSPGTGGDAEGDTLYLDDLARFAYDIDMRKAADGSDLAGKSWDNTGFNKQNLSTYTIGFTTSSDQMLIDAADDSHGRGKYFQTGDSAGLTAALNLALSDIYAKAGSGGGGATNSSTLSNGTRFYQTLYDPKDWHGTIKAFNLNATTGALSTTVWSTDSLITSSSPGPFFESWNTVSGSRIALDYNNLTGAQKTAFDTTLPTGVTGAQLVNWSKGTANARLRARTILLGDVINSPLTTALPTDKTSADLAGNTSYSAYLTTKASNMNYNLLVNANDGFFNVINPDTGVRRYAYMPSTSLASLATIASATYGSGSHKFTVDGQISVFDTQAGTSWRTVAFGGTGAGGKAFFAIKLFEGSDNSIQALWEVKAPDTSSPANPFNNLGYAYSKPDVARMADGTSIVVLGNGYGSFTGDASLFVLNANTGALIREIPIPASAKLADNGLSSVKLRVNAQNVVQAAYAGDLKGRLWKFDMSSTSANGWGVAFNNKPLFTAIAPDSTPQPIIVQPLLLDHPTNGKMVYFGTGKFSETSDKTTNSQQAFYAVWDADGATGGYVQGNLQPQTITGTITGNGATYYTTSNNDVDWTLKKGWYMTLSTTEPYIGERIIYSAQTSRGRIIFTTAAVNSSDPCESTGTGRLFELDAAKGGMLNYQVLDTNGDGNIDANDIRVSGIRNGTGIPNLVAVVSSPTGKDDTKYLVDSSSNQGINLQEKGGSVNQRIMWRQIQ
ncbi:pilus assembly protein [Pseudomonas folii]|uniref:Pilus assembly protein n=1 Tax=Pseudomonas folii TaxID=2762593 RepID=A0ABR7AZQ2_9PSED|nr:PilC/PilY family type IV pilus protein [Pseudomonas folii]MBC3950416.1 pilus assembly protein [Pseudomonas folii]